MLVSNFFFPDLFEELLRFLCSRLQPIECPPSPRLLMTMIGEVELNSETSPCCCCCWFLIFAWDWRGWCLVAEQPGILCWSHYDGTTEKRLRRCQRYLLSKDCRPIVHYFTSCWDTIEWTWLFSQRFLPKNIAQPILHKVTRFTTEMNRSHWSWPSHNLKLRVTPKTDWVTAIFHFGGGSGQNPKPDNFSH